MSPEILLTPGPTPLPESVIKALSMPIPHHRTPAFEEIFSRVRKNLATLLGTKSDALLLACTGTGAMEASISNLFSPGESVLVVNAGKFGSRFTEIAKAFSLDAHEVFVERGEAVSIDAVRLKMKQGKYKALFAQACETSTGARMPIRELAPIAHENGALFIVDGVTGCGVFPLPMDAWGIDVLLTASQKALMLPPGLAMIALSERAWTVAENAKLPCYYFDLFEERSMQTKNQTAWTPAISLIVGLDEALNLLFREGLEQVYARHEMLARFTRDGIQAMGLELFAKTSPSPGITSIRIPENLKDGKKIPELMRTRHGVVITGGQDELAGKIIRISHMGAVTKKDLQAGLSALSQVLTTLGHKP